MTDMEWDAYVLTMFAKAINPRIHIEEAYSFCYAFLEDDTTSPEAAVYWGDLISGTAYEPESGIH